jgi:hypothetical protein
MYRRVVSEYTDVSEVRTTYIIIMMEALRISETSVYSNETIRGTFQKALNFKKKHVFR